MGMLAQIVHEKHGATEWLGLPMRSVSKRVFVEKPFDDDLLLTAIETALATQPASAPSATRRR
jgi:hypothetical protein